MQTVILDESYKEQIKALWEKDFLGVPFNSVIDDLLKSRHFIGIIDEGNLIAMCGYKEMKRSNEIQVVKLCVHKDYRNKGIAISLVRALKFIARQKHKVLVAHCRDGAPNNTFYDKIGTLIRIEQRKTMGVRIYVIDKL